MRYDPGLTILTDPDVYPPSEDSILLIESLEVSPGERVLEIGCGSGVVSIHCAKSGCSVECGDINPKAVELARRNAELNGSEIKAVLTDVYSDIEGRFDTIIFNLPYLPVDDEGDLARAWSGGPDGMGPLPRLLEGAPSHLSPGGRVVVVVSSLMDKAALDDALSGLKVTTLGASHMFFETLSVLEIRFRHPIRDGNLYYTYHGGLRMAIVTVTCPVNPSEDEGKVRKAVLSLFPDAELQLDDGVLSGPATLERFHRVIRKERILDATRSVLLKNMKGDRTSMSLNKQVATKGKVSFADRNPVLGAIEVTIQDDDIQTLIDRLAPVTVDGEEVAPA